ncbi:MAG: hypothetical protein H8E46_01355 [FCB group bacterium]|nr:hypothetical protein [FCB group bacterium]
MIDTRNKFPPASIPQEKIYKGTIGGLTERIKKLYDAIYDRFGEEGLDLIREVSIEYGTQIAESVKAKQGVMDLKKTAALLVRIFNGMLADGEITEYDDKRVTIMVKNCPYPFTNPRICQAHTSMEEALVKGLNPDLDYVIEKCIPCGDSECWHVLKVKE